MLISVQGIIIRLNVSGISEIGRNTQGVRVMKLDGGDKLASVVVV
ncbi:MAG: gyrase subunit A protein [Candidatus Yanofskybacteria bacterium GW2011_GWA2_44_9]|uniref:Gyrase subunit A protein n=1 Tax=Candidatus Yanofskybacteria bacterium GW2011_GWA2_44_9 TaxID=1619025 RepID=A0A0G1KD94_9BACT|nr:MAG: gyrase subunit A protein [Candidatus Yanofskybacteria bacterium GW2011_GWA2_44_9]